MCALVEVSGEFVTAKIQNLQVTRQPNQETKLFQTQVGSHQVASSPLRVGGFDQPFQHVQSRRLNPVTDQELAIARKPFNGRHQPQDEAVVGL